MKNKYVFLLTGIAVGAILMLAGMSLFKSDYENKVQNNTAQHEDKVTQEHSEEPIIQLTNSEIEELGIKLDKVSSQKLELHLNLTGEIVPNPDKLAHIVPRFTGVVKSVFKEIGDRINKDEVIAIIESNESLVTYEVKSSIAGVVLELHMTPGELIGDDKHIVTIADLRSVWAELNIYQKDIKKIKVGQQAKVYFDDIENSVKTKIFYISPTVDEHTRTATARVRLDNYKGNWKPGMFVTAKVTTDFVEVEKAVTLNAIQNYKDLKVIFIKTDNGFKPMPIKLGTLNTEYAELLNDIKLGQIYISEGAFVIKSELLKESFGGGHAH